MDLPITLSEFFAVITLISLSAGMSSSEIALFSLTPLQIKSFRKISSTTRRYIYTLTKDPAGLLLSILITNELVNISLSSLISSWVSRHPVWVEQIVTRFPILNYFPDWFKSAGLATLLSTPVIVLFCEVTPKIFGATLNQSIAPNASIGLYYLYRFFSPIRLALKRLARGALSIHDSTKPIDKERHERDILSLLEDATKSGDVQRVEFALIKNILELDDIPVREVMTPISSIVSFSHATTLEQAWSKIRSKKSGQLYSRIPIYSSDPRRIIGILHSKDLLIAKLSGEDFSQSVVRYMWRPLEIDDTTLLSHAFRKMRVFKTHMAVVYTHGSRDRAHSAIGIITMHDVLHALLEDYKISSPQQGALPSIKTSGDGGVLS